MTPNPSPFPELNAILHDLARRAQSILGDNFTGAYMQGSLATGGFDEHSDADFIIVVERELNEEEVAQLQAMHARLYDQDLHWAKHLEGSYFPRDVLWSVGEAGKPLWYLDHGSRQMIYHDHCNTVVVRWALREGGLTLAGPPPATLVEPIAPDTLRRDIYTTIRDWGQAILAEPEHYNNRFYQGLILLSYVRMLHDLHTGRNQSKRAGAEWAKANLDPKWHALLDRAWLTRPRPEVQVRQPADPADLAATLEFMQVVMARAEQFARQHGLD